MMGRTLLCSIGVAIFVLGISLKFLRLGATCGEPVERFAPPGVKEVRNILFIMADDHSAEVLECYDNPLVRTPNLDRLASKGVRFSRAYANSPVCTPSRQSIITGKLPHATGVTLLNTPLSEEQVTIAEHLSKFGFKTGAIGKMHFNSQLKHGFDYRIDLPDYRKHLEEHPPRKPPEGTKVKTTWRPFRDLARVWLNADMLPVGVFDSDSDGTYFSQKAVDFSGANKDNRFCLWVSFYQPHSPFDFPIEYTGKYDPGQMPLPEVGPEDIRWIPAVFRDLTEKDKRGIIASYYTSVEYLDKNVGLLLEELKKLGLEETTLVVYVGDHGYLLGHHGRFEKHTMWEPAVRAPLIIRDPQLAHGRIIGAMVEFIDLVPTILEKLGVPMMEGLQGKSLVPLISGKTDQHRDHVFSEFLPDNKALVRTEEWKYIFTSGKNDLSMGYATGNPAPGITHWLYNVQKDPGETKNLAGDPKYRKVLHELQHTMLHRFQETHPKVRELPSGLSIEQALVWFCEPPDLTGQGASPSPRK